MWSFPVVVTVVLTVVLPVAVPIEVSIQALFGRARSKSNKGSQHLWPAINTVIAA